MHLSADKYKAILKKVSKFFAYLAVIILLLQAILWFYATPVMKKAVSWSVITLTDSAYTASFEKIRASLFSGKIFIEDFRLIPDTTKKTEHNLYTVKFDKFIFGRIKFSKLLSKKSLEIKEVTFNKPQVKILSIKENLKDTTTTDSVPLSYAIVKEDFLSVFFNRLNSLKINKIAIIDGKFDFLKQKLGKTFRADKITLYINNFDISKNTLSRKSLFAENFEILIEDYSVDLGQTETLKSSKLYVSSQGQNIVLENLSLKPSAKNDSDNFFDFEAQSIELTGANFEDIYLNNRINVDKAIVKNSKLIFYKQKKNKSQHQATPGEIYNLLANRNVKLFAVNQLHLINTRYKQYQTLNSKRPLISTGQSDIKIEDFRIDSSSVFDTNRIFFAKKIFFDLNNVTVFSQDNIYYAHANRIFLNSSKKNAFVNNFIYKAVPSDRIIRKLKNKTNTVIVPYLKLDGLDIVEIYHKKSFDLSSIYMNNAVIRLGTTKKQRKNKNTVIEAKANINALNIKNSKFEYYISDTIGTKRISGIVSTSIKGLKYLPRKEAKEKSFYAKALDVDFKNLLVSASNQTHKLKIERFTISSKSSQTSITNLVIIPQDSIEKRLKEKGESMSYYIKIPSFTLDKTDLLNSFINNDYKIRKFNIKNAEIAITSYPELSNKEIKVKLKDLVRDNSGKRIVNHASASIIEIYQNIKEFSPHLYQILKYKQEAIDSISNVAFDAIYDVYIPLSKINTRDTTSSPTLEIERIAYSAYNQLKSDNLSIKAIDTLLNSTVYKINRIKESSKKPAFDIRVIASNLAQVADNLEIDTFNIYNTRLKLFKRADNTSTLVFDNKISLKLIGMDINRDSLDNCTRKLLCSDAAELVIKDYTFNLKDKIHKIKLEKLIFRSIDSSIIVKNLFINADTNKIKSNKLIISTAIPEIKIKGMDYWKYLDEHILAIEKISSRNMFVHLLKFEKDTAQTQKKNAKKSGQIILPVSVLKQIQIDTISVAGQMIYNTSPQKNDIRSKFDFELNGFRLDSITTPSDYTFYVPLDKFMLKLADINYSNQSTSIKIDSLYANNNIDISLKNLTAGNKKFGSTLKSLKLTGFNFDKIKTKDLYINTLETDSLNLTMEKEQDSSGNKKQISIDSLNLYKVISPFLHSLYIGKLSLNNIFYPTDIMTYNGISIESENLAIDSLSTIRKPKLFYADDWEITIDGIEKDLGDYYRVSLDKLKVDLKKQQILSDNLVLTTTKTYSDILNSLKWRTTIMDVRSSMISINKIDWDKLIFEKAIKAKNITINDLIFYGYTDKNLPHNKYKRKPHYIELLAKLPVPLSINTIKLVNGTIIYDERAEKAKQKGRIILNRVNALLTNVDNTDYGNSYIVLLLSGLLENQGELFIKGSFKLDTVHYPFRMYGSLNRFDMTKLNNFTAYAANFEINSGYLNSSNFYMEGFDTVVSGTMNLKYNNLSVTLLKNKEHKEPKKLKFLSFVADVIVRKDNPKYGIFNKIGNIAYIHDPTYSDIKFWIKGIISGIKSVVLKDNKRDIKQIMKIKEYYQNEIFGNSSRLKSINNNKLRKNE